MMILACVYRLGEGCGCRCVCVRGCVGGGPCVCVGVRGCGLEGYVLCRNTFYYRFSFLTFLFVSPVCLFLSI